MTPECVTTGLAVGQITGGNTESLKCMENVVTQCSHTFG